MDAGNVKWVRLGDYIEQCDERNHSNKYGIEAIKGISTSKTFIDTKANLDGVPLQSYKLVAPRYLHMFLTRQDEEIKLPWLLMTVLVHI